MRIYTKTGDKGTTGLIGGTRVSKSDVRLDAYGTVDELNSFIGLLLVEINDADTCKFLQFIQQKLFVVGGYLATDMTKIEISSENRIWGNDIALVEQQIDLIDTLLPPLKSFILPAGSRSAALAHVCRTVCRRAERCITSLSEATPLDDDNPLIFINRLSDYFFILARIENLRNSIDEIFWK